MGGGSKGEAQKKRDGSESKINDRKTETITEEAEGKELEKQKEKDIGTGLERKEQLNGGREDILEKVLSTQSRWGCF